MYLSIYKGHIVYTIYHVYIAVYGIIYVYTV